MRKVKWVLFLFLPFFAAAQPGTAWDSASAKWTGEQVHIHRNAVAYVAGETVFFKAYVMAGLYPSRFSSSLLVTFYKGDSIMLRSSFPIVSGVSIGSFDLPLDMEGGRYFLAAHTSQSVKEHESPIYFAPLSVLHPYKGAGFRPLDYKPKSALQTSFATAHPVANLQQTFWISVSDQFSQPVAAKGRLLNSKGIELAAFETNRYGNAALQYTPLLGESYRIQWISGAETKESHLPLAQSSGAVLNLGVDGDSYLVSCYATPDLKAENFWLFAESGQKKLLLQEMGLLSAGKKLRLPIDQLPTGVVRFTLLNVRDSAMAETFVFSNNPEGLAEVRVSNRKDSLQLLFDADVDGTLSALQSETAGEEKESIINRLLLSSHFATPIPNIYNLTNDLGNAPFEIINSLLATRPLKIPRWQDLSALKQAAPVNSDADYIRIEGRIDRPGNKAIPAGSRLNMIFTTKDSSVSVATAPLDAAGKFALSGLIYTDSMEVRYQLLSKRNAPIPVKASIDYHSLISLRNANPDVQELISAFVPLTRDSTAPIPPAVVRRWEALSSNLGRSKMLEEVRVISKLSLHAKTQRTESKYASGLFAGGNSRTIDFVNNPPRSSINLLEYLRRYSNFRMNVTPQGIFSQTSLTGPVPWFVFVDERQSDFEQLGFMPVADVALVKMYANGFLGSPGNAPALAVYTRKSEDLLDNSTKPSLGFVKFLGYSPAKDFNPDNASDSALASENNPPRIHWDPYLLINTEKQSLTIPRLMNGEETKPNWLEVEGFSSNGRLLFYRRNF